VAGKRGVSLLGRLGKGLLSLFGLGSLSSGSSLLGLLSKGDSVLLLVELSEGGGINLDNSVLDQRVGSNVLSVGGVVRSLEDSALSGDGLRGPGEVSSLETESSVLDISSSSSNGVDSDGSNSGHGGGSSERKLSLMSRDGLSSSGGSSL